MSVWDHHYGVGVFEGVRAYGTEQGAVVFRLKEHTQRLLRSAQIMKVQLPKAWSAEKLNDLQVELLRRNRLSNAYLRPFVFYGGFLGLKPSTRDLEVHVAIVAAEWRQGEAVRTASGARHGVALRTASFTRPSAGASLCKAKANANYMAGILALQEAQASGADDVLMLDENGMVAETSGANLFMVRDGVLYTPSRESVLEGITRDSILYFAREFGWQVQECRLCREDIYVADEVFLTGTASEVTPVREVDGRPIGAGEPGPVTEQLQSVYSSHVRGVGTYRNDWLTRIKVEA
jgi:branched-chain amino acid aminotransferase